MSAVWLYLLGFVLTTSALRGYLVSTGQAPLGWNLNKEFSLFRHLPLPVCLADRESASFVIATWQIRVKVTRGSKSLASAQPHPTRWLKNKARLGLAAWGSEALVVTKGAFLSSSEYFKLRLVCTVPKINKGTLKTVAAAHPPGNGKVELELTQSQHCWRQIWPFFVFALEQMTKQTRPGAWTSRNH